MAYIFEYKNYRNFLKDHLQYKKENSTSFSLGVWARLLNVSNRSVLANILNGNRHPGKELQIKFNKYFSFSEDEAKYFSDLVAFMKVQEKKKQIDIMMKTVQAENNQIPDLMILDQVVYLNSEELQKIKNIMSSFQTKYQEHQQGYCLKIELSQPETV